MSWGTSGSTVQGVWMGEGGCWGVLGVLGGVVERGNKECELMYVYLYPWSCMETSCAHHDCVCIMYRVCLCTPQTPNKHPPAMVHNVARVDCLGTN